MADRAPYSLIDGEAGLARVVVAGWISDRPGPFGQEDFENAMAWVPDDIVLATEADDTPRLTFLRRFAIAMLLAENAYGLETHETLQ